MNPKWIFSLFLLTCLMMCHRGFTQNEDDIFSEPDMNMIPSPEIWSFMKYGNIKPDLYTGTVAVTIPVYVYKDADFEIPISLNYASNGYMPNNQASSAGLGWYLSAGGYITREVVGFRDEIRSTNLATPEGFYQYYLSGTTPPDDDSIFDLGDMDIRINPMQFVFKQSKYSSIEPTPDIFSFHFPGHRGKFSMGCQQVYVYDTEKPHGEYKVDITKIVPSVNNYLQKGSQISITTGDGYKYTFARVENMGQIDRYIKDGPTYRYQYNEAPKNYWVLTEIQAPNKRIVRFLYGDEEYSDKSQYYWRKYDSDNRYVVTTREHVHQLKQIKIDDVTIDFGYETRTDEKVRFLREGKQFTPSELKSPKQLRYIFVSTAGKGIKRCALSYRYAPDNDNPVMFLTSVDVEGEGIYAMDYYDMETSFPAHATSALDHWGYYNFSGKGTVSYNRTDLYPTVEVDNFNRETITSHNRDPYFFAARKGMLRKITYPTKGYSCFYYEPHSYTAYVTRDMTYAQTGGCHYNFPYLAKCAEREAGGVRIRKITDYTAPADSTYREYTYSRTKDGIEEGSGILLFSPRYSVYGTTRPFNLAAYSMDQAHIEYAEVKEYFPDKSYKQYRYSNYETLPDLRPEFRFWFSKGVMSNATDERLYMKFDCASRATQRGKLLLVENHDSDGKRLEATEYTYDYNKNLKTHIAVSGSGAFFRHRMFVEDYPLVKITAHTFGKHFMRSNEQNYLYNSRGQICKRRHRDSEGRTVSDSILYVADLDRGFLTEAERAVLKKNMLNAPKRRFTTTDSDGGHVIQGQRYIYESRNALPHIQSIETAIPVPSQTDLKYYPQVTCEKCDTLGRVLRIKHEGTPVTNYIWGYGGLYPVAKIEYAALSDITAVPGLQHIEQGPLTGGLNEAQNKLLREIAGASVTTYDYQPLIGLTEIRDPAGHKTLYRYNPMGKLQEIVDNDGNPVKTYQYSTDEF